MGVRQEGIVFTDDSSARILEMEYDANSNLIYLGQAKRGSAKAAASWRINKLSYDANGNIIEMLEAPNFVQYGDIWDNRAALSYA